MATVESNQNLDKMQNVLFTENEHSEYDTNIWAPRVNIQAGDGNHLLGSSKVQLTDRINYNWEYKYYRGNLIVAHISGNIVAFTMKNKDGSMVRVASQINAEKKTLIRNLKGDVKDLAFSYCRVEIILGCIDSARNILIYNIEENSDSLVCTLIFHVYHDTPITTDKFFRLIWCPFVPSYNDDDLDIDEDPDKMFVILNGRRAELYNVAILTKKYPAVPLSPNDSYEGYIGITHTSDITHASFALDGSAIAIACRDGSVKFFQICMTSAPKQKCLHEWKPHNGKPLSSIIFIDNVLVYSSECWKFTITAANNDTEIKIWSCETWSCLQMISFCQNPKSKVPDLFCNMALDYSGQFLVVSDINNNGMYVLHLEKSDKGISATRLHYFQLPSTFLSFHIMNAEIKSGYYYDNHGNDDEDYNNDLEYLEDSTDVEEVEVLNLKLLIIQPKRYQECNIKYPIGCWRDNTQNITSSSSTALPYNEVNKPEEKEEESVQKKQIDDFQNSVNLLIQQQQLDNHNPKKTLMTPDDFTSPGKTPKSNRNSLPNEKALDEQVVKIEDNDIIGFQRPQKDNYTSAGSSPSREVQEIFSLNNSATFSNAQEFLANLDTQEIEEPQKDYSATADNNLLYQETWSKIRAIQNNDTIKQMNEANNTDINNQDLETVYIRINTLETLIRDQNTMLQQLSQDIKILNHATAKSKDETKQELFSELETIMSTQQQQTSKMLENLFEHIKTKDKEMQDQMFVRINKLITDLTKDKIQQIIRGEIEKLVLPVIQTSIDSYHRDIHNLYASKLTSLDGILKENFAKVISSKSLTESISLSVVSLISPSLEKCYLDIIHKSLVPSWEKICEKMFQQINDTFTKGTKEYTSSVETYMERQRKVQEKGKDVINQMQTVSEHMKNNADKVSEVIGSEIQKQLVSIFKNMQEKLMINMKESISQEIKDGFKNQNQLLEEGVMNAVRSKTVTPAPQSDHTTILNHIQQCISKRNYDEAFQYALSAENLIYVIFACERVDPGQVFTEQCKLSQSVLLALIQQLSMEMHKNTEIKLCFIRAAFLALTFDAPQTKHFIPNVLKDLLKQLALFMQTNPPLKQMTDSRLLKMAVENILSK